MLDRIVGWMKSRKNLSMKKKRVMSTGGMLLYRAGLS